MSQDKVFGRGGTTALILVVLRDSPSHGYEIARELERRSDNTLSLKYGTLYPILHELEKNGFITAYWEHPDGERRSRKVYQLTEAGQIEVARALTEWEIFSQAINKVIGRKPGEQPA